jgi:uncharacterized membrane protein (UPF0182 family)
MSSAVTATTARLRGGWDTTSRRVSLWRTPRTRALLLLGTVSGAFALIAVATQIYTDLLWFRELGHEDVFWTTLRWKLMAKGVVGLGTASFLLLNFAVVDRIMARRAGAATMRAPITVIWNQRRLVYPLVAITVGVLNATRWSNVGWGHLLLWVHRSDFGQQDPLFHRDIGFFVFSLPIYREVTSWLLETAAIAAVVTLAAYAIAGGLRVAPPLAMARAARAHLLSLVALLLLVLAWRFRLEQFTLAVPHNGSVVPGASYTDVRVRLPLLQLLTGLALVGAVLCVYAAVRRVPVRSLALVTALAVLALVGMSRLPGLVERFHVEPQELSRERPHVSRAISATRQAYGLDAIKQQPLVGSSLSAGEVAENHSTLENVPVWDAGVMRSTMNELESIGTYYSFARPTVDRYTIDGVPRLMTVAARQLDLGRLDPSAKSWANKRFAYTHGYGVVGIRANGMDAERFPYFEQREFDTQSNPLRLREPRTYYGERRRSDPPYLITPSKRGEVEEPTPGSRSSTYHYDGSGGIPLSNRLRRAAFAARFRDLKLLLSQTVTDHSRIVLRRDVHQRLLTLAPFLRWDERPQTAVVGGRVMYLFHGYTTSDDYPYSARIRMGRSEVNYVREAARAAVDAFSGRVTIYAADSSDPILRAWQAAYPSLFLSPSRMPRELRAHLRYPEALFAAQTRVYATYHAVDPNAFWTGSDVWQRPLQLAGPVEAAGEVHFPDPERTLDSDEKTENGVTSNVWRMRPDYLMARLPGDSKERFFLATPFTPRGRHNLVGYLAGTIDPQGRPQLTVLNLPRDRLTIGPAQATRRILASPGVARRLELLNRESRDLGKAAVLRTVLGAPQVVPLGGELVTFQSVYSAAGGDGVPRLHLVAVHANGRVGFGRNAGAALRRMLRIEARERADAAAAALKRARQQQAP